MNIYSLASKSIGAVTAGLVLYDAHKNGAISATMNSKKYVADTLVDQYVQSERTNRVSSVEVGAKKAWFNYMLDNNFTEAIVSTCSYVKGAWNSFVSDVVPAALATGAMIGGPRTGKLCGLGLALYGIKYMLYDVMSLGKRNYLNENC